MTVMKRYNSGLCEKERVAIIREKIQTDWNLARRALLVIHSKQTLQEREARNSAALNGEGFNSEDAPILCRIAQRILYGNHRGLHSVLNSDREWVLKLMPKYAGQLDRIAQEKMRERAGMYD